MNIKLKELRIGNLLQEGTVTSLNINGDETVGFNNEGLLGIEDVTPKVITYEFLIECGFAVNIEGDALLLIIPRTFYFEAIKNNQQLYEIWCGHEEEVLDVGFFIHQLQNFYFTIAGKELIQ